MGPTRKIVGSVLIAFMVSACDPNLGGFPLGFDAKLYAESKNHLFTYASPEQLPIGAIVRAMPIPGAYVPVLKNACPSDIARIKPTSTEEVYDDIHLDRSQADFSHIVHIIIPGARVPIADYVDRVRLKYENVKRIVLQEGEIDRIKRSLSSECRSAIKGGQEQDKFEYFLITAFVIVGDLKIAVLYRPEAAQKAGFDPRKTRVNGVTALQTEGTAKSIHRGNNLIVELNPLKLEGF